jgi:hypothetical protein
MRTLGEYDHAPIVDGPPPSGLFKLSCCLGRMTSVQQSKLVGEPLAVLDQSLGQYEPETSHRQLEHSSAPHSGAQGWADFPFATTWHSVVGWRRRKTATST